MSRIPEDLSIDALRRKAVEALDAKLRADVSEQRCPPGQYREPFHEAVLDATYSYYAALTQFKFALREL